MPGEIVVSNVEPWTQVTPFNNQTMIIPVKNGTNYVIFDNGNANQQHGVNPFSINVTFSMTYHGFKRYSYTSTTKYNNLSLKCNTMGEIPRRLSFAK